MPERLRIPEYAWRRLIPVAAVGAHTYLSLTAVAHERAEFGVAAAQAANIADGPGEFAAPILSHQ
ncbi:MAG: hypothetical protein ABW318_15225 [Vicinamibacterales bacterium]